MGETTAISWCASTFNPWIGCTKISQGCAHCYAERDNARFNWVDKWGISGTRARTSEANWNNVRKWNAKAEKSGIRKSVFCASLADVFEFNPPQLNEWRKDLFALIGECASLDWLLLTKRPHHVMKMVADATGNPDWLAENEHVAIGISVENQMAADLRLSYLWGINAAMRFLSVEPMLGPVDLGAIERCAMCGEPPADNGDWLSYGDGSRAHIHEDFNAPVHTQKIVDWVIVGGESGPDARPMSLEWARDVKRQCEEFRVPFFFKQIGGSGHDAKDYSLVPEDLQVREFPEW